MVLTAHRGLDIAQYRVHAGKLRFFYRCSTAAGPDRALHVTRIGNSVEACQSITDDRTASRNRGLMVAEICWLLFAVRQTATFVVSATAALQAVWPAPMEKRIEGSLFSAVVFEKVRQADAFPGLNLVFSWDYLILYQ